MIETIVAILNKKVNGVALSYDEQMYLDQWMARSPHFIELVEEVKDPELLHAELRKMLAFDTKTNWKKFRSKVTKKNSYGIVSFFRHHPFRYAATIAGLLVLLSSVAYLVLSNHFHTQSRVFSTKQAEQIVHDIEPATDKATLTIGDSKHIVLDNSLSGSIYNQGNVNVVKTKTGELAYTAVGNTTDKVVYQTLSVPRGGKPYTLQLADSSLVLVNAASSVTFPVPFSGNERKLSLTGEAYFEVTKNAKKPFRVDVNGTTIEVLGTHFNINSYSDEEKMKVTLLEGSVKVSSAKASATKGVTIKPGEQAQVDDKSIAVERNLDLEAIMSWKNRVFVFRKEKMSTIMRQVSREYNADVVFDDEIGGHYVATGISRDVTVSKLLDIFEKTGAVYFDIEGKKITVKSGRRPL